MRVATDTRILLAGVLAVVCSAAFGAISGGLSFGDEPEIEPLQWDGRVKRRRDAKRLNEHLKLLSTFFNNLGIATVVTVIVASAVNPATKVSGFQVVMALLVAAMLHISGQVVLRNWKSEE